MGVVKGRCTELSCLLEVIKDAAIEGLSQQTQHMQQSD